VRYLLALFVLVLSGCDAGRSACPQMRTEFGDSGIRWGGEQILAQAQLTKVSAECLSRERDGSAVVTIALTVQVESIGYDGEWLSPSEESTRRGRYWRSRDLGASHEEALRIADRAIVVPKSELVFEAFSSSGVLLRSAKADFEWRNTKGAWVGDLVSARISGLSPDEAKRVQNVRVRWLYD